jgi:hypothetical protein
VDIYLRRGRAYKVPILLVKDLVRCNPAQYSEPLTTHRYNAIVAEAREDGFPIFEILLETPWHRVSDAESAYREIFGSISDGLSFLAFHFNTPGDFEAIEPEYAHIRTEEYALFQDPTDCQVVAGLRSGVCRISGNPRQLTVALDRPKHLS